MLIVYFLSTLIFYYVTSEKHVRLFSKTRTTFLINMYDFPVKHNRVFKLLMFSDLYFCIIHLLYGKLSHRHSINHIYLHVEVRHAMSL